LNFFSFLEFILIKALVIEKLNLNLRNLYNGLPIAPKTLWNMTEQLKRRIVKMLDHGGLDDKEEIEKLRYLLGTKKWNPYYIRHSAITSDSDYLSDFVLKKKVRWSMNSKQASKYIKNRMGNELKRQILVHNGVISGNDLQAKSSVLICPRCSLVNAIDNKYCSRYSYLLVQAALDQRSKGYETADFEGKI
jgi:integrase/recombinase XerD